MVDEVFVTVRYEAADFMRGQRLGLLTKARDRGLVQLCVFLLVGIGGALFFAPAGLGRFVAAAGCAVIGLAILVFGWGWLSAKAALPPELGEAIGVEVSDEGLALKKGDGYVRLGWGSFDRVAYGLGVFMLFGRQSILIPRRVLRGEQFDTLRALILAHEDEVGREPPPAGGSADDPARPATAKEHDERAREPGKSKRDGPPR